MSAVPPEGWRVAPSAVPGIEVWEPIPDDPRLRQAPSGGVRCPRCAATLAYDPDRGALACGQCGFHHRSGADSGQDHRSRFTPEAISQASAAWELQRRDLHCDGCGVDLAVEEGSLVALCPFCGSNQILLREGGVRGLRPSWVLPFAVSGDSVAEPVAAWLGRGWLHPPDLARAASLDRFTGIYLPFWIFDAQCDARWRAEVGITRTRTVTRGGKRHVETTTDWSWQEGRIHVDLSNRTQSGTTKLPPWLFRALGRFDLGELREYRPDYLAGWQALTYDIGLTEAWDMGRESMREEVRRRCKGDARGDQVRHLTVQADFNEEAWRYCLLPAHLCAYQYQGKTYRIAVNGHTGQVAGTRPVLWGRVWAACGVILLPAIVAGLVGLALLIVGIGAFFLVLSLILLIVGLIGSAALVRHASHLEDPQ